MSQATPQIDIQAPLLPDLVRLHGKWIPNKTAFIDNQVTRNWREIDENTNRIANGLLAAGVKQGDTVSILMSNCVEYAEIIYGVFKAGAVVVPLNLAVTEEGLTAMNVDADVKLAFYTPEQYKRMQPFLSQIPSIGTHIIFGDEKFDSTLNYNDWLTAQSADAPNVKIADTDVCNIIYSSGTTGRPKGIKHIHRRRIQALYEMALMHRYHYGAVSITAIGLYSNISWGPLLLSLLVGAPCIIMENFVPEKWVELVEKHKVTHTMMAPVLFQNVLKASNFSKHAVASLQAVVSGGSPLYEDLKQEITDNFVNCAVVELYGLTEGFITSLQPEEMEGRLASVGKPVCGNDYILLDNDDNILDWGNSGEICVRSVHLMTEYHNRADATSECMFTDPQGQLWIRTGDIGSIDEQGFLYITDRKKDMIISGGQNIYPADIEAVMIKHEAISEVAVIGVPDEKWGETPIAIIVPTDENTDPEELKDWTNETVGKRQRIKQVIVRADMPRNPNGKILKRKLKEELQ